MFCCGRKIPGITVRKQKNAKQSHTSSSRRSEPDMITNGLRGGPLGRILNTSSPSCRISILSVGESEASWVISAVEATPAPPQQNQIDEPQSVKVHPIAAEELEISNDDDQCKNKSVPPTVQVPSHNAVQLPVANSELQLNNI